MLRKPQVYASLWMVQNEWLCLSVAERLHLDAYQDSAGKGQFKLNRKKWRLLPLLACTLLVGGCAMGGATGQKTTEGIAALTDGDYARAKELFDEAVRSNEQQMLAYRGLGLAYMGLAQYEDAGQAFEAALAEADDKMPENTADLRLYLAACQYRMEDYEEAADTCTELLEAAEEGVADAYYLRGASELHEGNQNDAKSDFDRAVALEPGDYDLYLNIYEVYSKMSLSGIGGEYLQSALNIQGSELEDYYNRGRIYYYLENYTEAQSQLIGAVEQGYEPAMELIGRVYLAQGDSEHAQAIYEQLGAAFGESASSYNGLALCAMQRGEYDAALSYIGQGLALDGTESKQELYFNEIVAYEKKLDFATAKQKAEAYVANYPSDAAGQKEYTFLKSRS